MILEGVVWKFGKEIDTDIIMPSRYLELPLADYRKHVMEPVRPGFFSMVKPGDFIFAGEGFGIGSSRGQAVAAIKDIGIKAIVAVSFGRIFFRSAINDGLPLIESTLAYQNTDEGDVVRIEVSSGRIKNKTKGSEFTFQPFPSLLFEILEAGGGTSYYKNKFRPKEERLGKGNE